MAWATAAFTLPPPTEAVSGPGHWQWRPYANALSPVEVIDMLLDQEGLEIDEIDRMEQDTPLHKAVRYVNSLEKDVWPHGQSIVAMLLDAGCDPRIRNKAKLKPVELVDPRNTELRSMLQKGEFAMQAGGDIVEDDDDGPAGSASDSD